ncbi:MAG: nucleotidyltransferase domain-containing protein [Burkholderiales bacterium]
MLALLFGQPERSFYATEVIGLLGAGSGSVQRELARLEHSGLITVRRVGTQKHYQANRDSPIFAELRGIASKMIDPATRTAGANAGEVYASAPVSPPAHTVHSPSAAYAPVRAAKLRISPDRLAALCRDYGVRKLSLFGSAARGELTPDSDVDVMVEFDPGSRTSLFDLPALQTALSGLFGGRRVDVTTPEILDNPYRRRAIEPELKTLYAA